MSKLAGLTFLTVGIGLLDVTAGAITAIVIGSLKIIYTVTAPR